jgi:hypothetical protein
MDKEDGRREGLAVIELCWPGLFVRPESSRSIERVLRSGRYMLVDIREI